MTANALPCALFQSTPPVKAATNASDGLKASLDISIHAAREGGDLHSLHRIPGQHRFQSTPPVKAATVLAAAFNMDKAISIHAAREGGDR